MHDLTQALHESRPLVVGAAGTPSILATSVSAGECDLIELRLDLLGCGAPVREFAERHRRRFPILLTARHPGEGGRPPGDPETRRAALLEMLPAAAAIDLELQSIGELAAVWNEARRLRLLRVASFHDFTGAPPPATLLDTIDSMHRAAADVAKLAFRIDRPAGLLQLADLLQTTPPLPLAVMGMGPLAPSSRLLAAQLGSVLNYGYLGDVPTAPGQWPARLLLEALKASGCRQ